MGSLASPGCLLCPRPKAGDWSLQEPCGSVDEAERGSSSESLPAAKHGAKAARTRLSDWDPGSRNSRARELGWLIFKVLECRNPVEPCVSLHCVSLTWPKKFTANTVGPFRWRVPAVRNTTYRKICCMTLGVYGSFLLRG